MSNSIQTKSNLNPWTRFWQSKTNKRRVIAVGKTLLALFLLFFTFLPILYVVSAAFNPSGGLAGQKLIPDNASLVNFETILAEPFWLWMWNSFKLATISSILAVTMTMFAAFSFSRFRFRYRSQLMMGTLLVQVFPAILTMVALFALLQQIGTYIPWLGLNSHGGLILLYMGGALGINVWLMKGFFDSIPRDIDESAMVDGATHWQIFWQLIFPLVRPVIAVVGILTFVGVYSDWVLASIMIQDQAKFTLMLGLQGFVQYDYGSAWGAYSAGAIIGALPIVIVYILLQDQIVGGLTAGSVKG
jgi:ABC-type maltose transport system permease subunit